MIEHANDELRRTPLYAEHVAAGARMVPFAGWEMPVQYTGVLDEVRAVRHATGLFDISHMGRLSVEGTAAERLLQRVTTNDIGALAVGGGQYSLLPSDAGGILDDVIVYRTGETAYLVVVNASNTARDLERLRETASGDATVTDITAATAMVAVQGPGSIDLVGRVAEGDVDRVERFGIGDDAIAGARVTLCRTGYTGEDGFEIILAASDSAALWTTLVAVGAAPCGLGARDALRIEAGYPLYGHEISEETSPVEAGLMWAVALEKGDFIGREAIAAVKARGPSRRLMGIVMDGRVLPRQGYALTVDGEDIGTVTSGAFSAARNAPIGMAFLDARLAKAGSEVQMVVRGVPHKATVIAKKKLLAREPAPSDS